MILLSTRNPMELTYLVRGADSKEYGPVKLEHLETWVRERRLIEQQEIRRSDMQHWAPAGSFSELQPLFATHAAAGPVSTPMFQAASPRAFDAAATAAHVKSAGSWFYWIAGFSLVNSLSPVVGNPIRFVIALGVTDLIDSYIGSQNRVAGLVLDLVAAGIFILFGVFATRGHLWAFIVGIVLFALDGVIFLVAQSWLGVALHGLVLFFLFRGVKACRVLNQSRL
jgi:hypothetical protein